MVTAVDRSPAMLRTARLEAESQGVQNIVFCEPDELFAQTNRFDFLVCYLVLQRMPPRDGLALVRRLIERIVPGGIGVFQFPYRTQASALISGSRWLREHVPGANAVVNSLRGQAGSQPFTPTHSYRTEDVLKIFEATDAPAAYLTLEDHGDVASVIAMTERPMAARRKRALSELVLRQAQDERVSLVVSPSNHEPTSHA
jgi:SAM-dependent methyltransferase